MSIHVALHHRTTYSYDRPVSLSPHIIRLRPAPHCRTSVLAYSLKVKPEKHFINWQQDPQGNYQARIVFPETSRELEITVDLVAEMSVYNPFDFFLESEAEYLPFVYEQRLSNELAAFMEIGEGGPLLKALVRESVPKKAQTTHFLVALNQRIQSLIRYVIRMEPGVQSPETTLELRSGSCRDSAWLLVQVLRRLGLAARFVSGYLIQLAPDVKALDGPSGTSFDFTDLHAWCEVYLPGAGWIGFDPTSGLLAGEGHIPVACTPDPANASPVTGAVDECESTFKHEMTVSRIHESPRVTKPYTDAQWKAIEELGHQIDGKLKDNDVRLTMGGEPTFVSIDDMDGPEWNIAALGPTKERLSGQLLKRLKAQFGPGGLLFYGQGKWYPGESLPRWSKACYWRKDGEPLWHRDDLCADETKDYGFGVEEAKRFAEALSEQLGIDSENLVPAYEDVYYYTWKERRLPSNVDPLKSKLVNSEERARLARIFEKGLGAVAGYVLPLKAGQNPGTWLSGKWFLREETLWLIPGDSPIGFRLPLDSLPWVAEKDFPWVHPKDPMAPLSPLPSAAPRVRQMKGIRPEIQEGNREPQQQESAAWIVRTALCVEARNGRLHVFLPPLRNIDEFLDLIASIETTAQETGLPIIIEGSAPPHDPRIQVIKVTPDPGVIEVNMHPVKTWDELVKNTLTLYEEARQNRLGTEKFMIDGRHVGTGGGNHIVIGAETPADSPLLRRPDLLRSLIGYWQNHPSLSILFSSLFIGPTSQHPRIDEARNDSLYELEIAFQQTPDAGRPCLPWLVDRLYRNLLIDVTGNTHRAEFCIDKLYSPDSASGRLGLLELRSFEMPPHAQMSLAQQLLLRALIARFWEKPYEQKPVRWGTDLHDRFMLPHFVKQDFDEVLDELKTCSYAFPEGAFAPHFEFKFPYIGEIAQRGIKLELRTALEPWHVMGEEAGAGGTVRYVDSSVERVQVKARGLVSERFVIACNGRRVPLHPTGTPGEFVAAVRYRAWQSPSSLHPTIPVQAPLVFDIIDGWNNKSLGGCVSHVMHPGGRNYTTFPINAYEAESRRLARFFAMGHSPGRVEVPRKEKNPDFPFTLDLRRFASFD